MQLLSTLHCTKNDVSNNALYHLAARDAHAKLHANAFPSMDSDAQENDWIHLVSVQSLSDDGNNIFLVESGERAKSLYGSDDDLLSVY
jgi:hypothetical protein